ncbi:MAG TPA: DUF262 domain-containing HNH endonuclease family protein [Polyangium sp.]|nr:DUF262 domain-containing HNH endonuclease family protein [Polyangium sp.]
MKFFNTTHNSLEEVFGADKTYSIPAYQRPYSWQSIGKTDQNNQVNRMWDDLWGFFSQNDKETEYFFGSMVVIQQKETRVFDVVDGQQRLTTLALLFAAMRCFIDKHCTDPVLAAFRDDSLSTLRKLLYNSTGVTLVQTLKVKIQRAAGYDYNEVLERAVRCEPTSKVTDQRYADVADRYFQNREYFRNRLESTFLTKGVFTIADAERFNQFFSFLYVRVAVVLITTSSFETAFMIFETLNNRGLPLSNVDLLRNFFLDKLEEAGETDAATMWTSLEKDSLTEDFMGRWVESWLGQQQRSSAFNDLRQIYANDEAFDNVPGRPRVRRFYETIQRDLQYYGLLAEPRERVQERAIQNKIRFFRVASNERYSMNLLMALFREQDYDGTANPTVLNFLRKYQCWMIHVLLSPGTRFSNSKIYEAIGLIRKHDVAGAAHLFDLSPDDKSLLIGYLAGEIRDHGIAKLLLAEYVWHEETLTPDVVDQQLRWPDATLEHIIPQSPAPNTNWIVDFSDTFRKDYTYRLGNMTLLTTKMNAAAKNYDFSKKRQHYRKTLLPLTRDLTAIECIAPADIEARHARIIASLLDALGLH